MSTAKIRAHFRLINCPYCSYQMCWVNPRLPGYCPECGKFILAQIRHIKPDCITFSTDNAWIEYEE